MKNVIRKLFFNYEKEEKWLNEMAAQGKALIKYTWCRYEFEDTPKGEYIYRVVLLDKQASHSESQKYIQFVEETGAEYVASYLRWVYFRKKAADGPFELYSDIDSKLRHYKKVQAAMTTAALINFATGILCIRFFFPQADVPYTAADTAFGVVGVCLLVFSVILFSLGAPIRKSVRRLAKEKEIHES